MQGTQQQTLRMTELGPVYRGCAQLLPWPGSSKAMAMDEVGSPILHLSEVNAGMAPQNLRSPCAELPPGLQQAPGELPGPQHQLGRPGAGLQPHTGRCTGARRPGAHCHLQGDRLCSIWHSKQQEQCFDTHAHSRQSGDATVLHTPLKLHCTSTFASAPHSCLLLQTSEPPPASAAQPETLQAMHVPFSAPAPPETSPAVPEASTAVRPDSPGQVHSKAGTQLVFAAQSRAGSHCFNTQRARHVLFANTILVSSASACWHPGNRICLRAPCAACIGWPGPRR